jgi:hypothetical protein
MKTTILSVRSEMLAVVLLIGCGADAPQVAEPGPRPAPAPISRTVSALPQTPALPPTTSATDPAAEVPAPTTTATDPDAPDPQQEAARLAQSLGLGGAPDDCAKQREAIAAAEAKLRASTEQSEDRKRARADAEAWIAKNCRKTEEKVYENESYVDANGFVKVRKVLAGTIDKIVCPAKTSEEIRKLGRLVPEGSTWVRYPGDDEPTPNRLPAGQVARSRTPVLSEKCGGPRRQSPGPRTFDTRPR